jgi:hypothetical protein
LAIAQVLECAVYCTQQLGGDLAEANALFSVSCGSRTVSRKHVTHEDVERFRELPDLIAQEKCKPLQRASMHRAGRFSIRLLRPTIGIFLKSLKEMAEFEFCTGTAPATPIIN